MPRRGYLGPLLGALLLIGAIGACGGGDNASDSEGLTAAGSEGITTADFVAAANPICQGFAADLQDQIAAQSPTWRLGPPYRAASTAMAALGVTAASSPEAFELHASMNEAADSIEALDAAIVEALVGEEEPGSMFATEDGKVWAGSSWEFARKLEVPPELALAAWRAQSRVREASIALGLSDCAFGGDDNAGGRGTPVTEPSLAAETAQATATPTPTPATPTPLPPSFTPSPAGLTYSGVVATYPIGTDLCGTQGDLAEAPGGYTVSGDGATVSMVDGAMTIQCYGTKLTVGDAPMTLDGKTYVPGTKLTVDENLDWIEVSSWE